MKLNIQRNFIFVASVFFILLVGWTLKNIYFSVEMGILPHKKGILLTSAGVILILISPLMVRISKWAFSLTFIFYVLVSFLLYADVVYQRYYHSILSIEMMGQAGQLKAVDDSILTLMRSTDIWYAADTLLLILFFFYPLTKMSYKRPGVHFVLVAFCLILGYSSMKYTYLHLVNDDFSEQLKVAKTGIIPTHISETYNSYMERMSAAEVFSSQDSIKQLKEYESELEKRQKTQQMSPYFGDAKGKNLIMIQAESLNDFIVNLEVNGQEVTPNLNAFIKESSYYPNTYLQIGRGNTSDAEFVANNSLYPSKKDGAYRTYENGVFQSLGQIFKNEGYETSAAHGNVPDFWNRKNAYPAQGYDIFYSKEHPAIDDSNVVGLGIDDKSFFKQLVDIWKKEDKPFYSFVVTLTNHRPFELPKEHQKLNLPAHMNDTPVGHYLQNVYYADQAFGQLLADLKQEGLYEDTVIVYYGDHYGLIPDNADQLKKDLNINFNKKEMFNIPLVIHRPTQTEGEVNEVIASQMDIAPTVTSLFGIEQPLYQLGYDLSMKKEGYVGFRHEITPFSFFSENYDFEMSLDGVFENGICTDTKTGEKVDVEKCRTNYDRVQYEVELSDFLLQYDAIEKLKKGKL
ncbi:LTA synthase family protein [Fictibacillus sp. b24]|uniref:LTA synthase family protein n=1 Tax=Fictibacillus sp. b24 TaxID=3055863 RepID=UPI0025A20CD4|nr:LTA synthase family protein [Fictibacillus sp. b24]MDM5315048.1 LTA synthase family protein [Fictibacillus sp. b24]